MSQIYDFIIVGAGSAGSAIARRLADHGQYQVLLLEAGGRGLNPWIRVPLGTGFVFNNKHLNWGYEGQPEPHLNNRVMYQPRGKGLGGTGAINGMIYCRGNAADFDNWRDLGCTGWGYDDVLPYFRKAEDQERGADAYHGVGGPVGVSGPASRHELADAFIASAGELGIPANPDFNGASQDGAGYFQYTIKNGFRVTPATAYLSRKPRNLDVVTGALANRILLEGKRAVGVEYRQDGQIAVARAKREVIVSAGTFNSAQLLQLSGIGPGPLLQSHGIATLVDQPEVGQNYQDHFGLRISYRCNEPVTLNDRVGSLWGQAKLGAQYALTRTGPAASPGLPAGCFVRSDPSLPAPDLELVLSLWTMVQGAKNKKRMVDPYSAFGIVIEDVQPDGRGTVTIQSNRPDQPPAIVSNMFATARDEAVMVKAVRLSRQLVEGKALARYRGEELVPGPAVTTDEQIVDFVRQNGFALYHPAGTCRMGSDEKSVVDSELRVRGVDGLRVADASIMPRITRGNINAVVGMIGERAADLVLQSRK